MPAVDPRPDLMASQIAASPSGGRGRDRLTLGRCIQSSRYVGPYVSGLLKHNDGSFIKTFAPLGEASNSNNPV